MAVRLLVLSSSSSPPKPPHLPDPKSDAIVARAASTGRREAAVSLLALSLASALGVSAARAAPEPAAASAPARNPVLTGVANTRSWFQFYGDGFSIRVPPLFEDIMEPEDYSAGFSYYGDKAKPKTYQARFASPDGSEVLSVVTRPSNQLKITFLEAQDITDLGTLKEAAKIFVPGGSNLYSARTIKIKEDETVRTYYFYEFGIETQHVALMAAINSGKAYIAGATAPQTKWEDDGVKLRSAAISMSVL